ncbi:S1C family serine protease [Agaribacter marinus]|uniref:Outer membrane-stress sensor serine endopeptidase DegS n=1 Tax=Agaribacter marinus TaxID=1431249 RepID=A0AA37WLQ0_9ALTE|nr:trypsin-like peptidase domain-containing protein [Agaribacter marinus]GLR72859.1 outer membrane-stress sensor serine endopeptidase DegS [Agaribacter marinus]
MSAINKIFIAVLKPALLGCVVAAILLLFFPEFREGEGLNVNILNREKTVPPRLSYYEALAQSAPAVANIYSQSYENTGIFSNRSYSRISLGSAVIMSNEGYLLTCYHVIRNADSIFVQLQDDRKFHAQLVGFDVITDLAVLKIHEAPDLVVMPQMESLNLRVGDIVMAVGNPLDLGQTITSGIVSRTGRKGLANYFDFIQTDAALNQGNSGGALIDSNGYLVGITNASFQSRNERVDGVNFAVPYALAKRVMDEIITSGTVTRGHLGVDGGELRDGTGFLVRSVDKGSPAALAGIRTNDVLTAVNGQTVTSAEIMEVVAESAPGTNLTFQVNRNGKVIHIQAVIGKLNPALIARS